MPQVVIIAHRAGEAYAEGRFESAAEQLGEYMRLAPDDVSAWLTQGDYLSCAGRLPEAVAHYAQYARRGGDARTAGERVVRTTAALDTAVRAGGGVLFDAEALASRAGERAPGLRAETASRALELAGEWNGFLAGRERRAEHYRRALGSAEERSDCLFVVPPYLNFAAGYPPYGVGVLQHFLSRHGRRSAIADLNLALYEAVGPERPDWWDIARSFHLWQEPYRFLTDVGLQLDGELAALAEILAATPATVLGISCFHVTRSSVLRLLPALRGAEVRARIVLGGPDCFYPNQCLDRYGSVFDCIDAFVAGEGETALLELLGACERGEPLADVRGVLVPALGPAAAAARYRRAEPTAREDLAGFPDFAPEYLARVPQPLCRLTATNRGCVNRCDFCYDRKAWQRFRMRPAADVAAEIRHNAERYGCRLFHLVDTATNASIPHLESLCDLLAEPPVDISITTSVMVSERMTAAIYAKMRRAGFRTLYFGVESGSTAVLDAMGKRGGAEEAGRNLRLSAEAGLVNRLFLIVGHPAEGRKEFRETLRFLKVNRPWIHELAMVNPCQILQDTDLAERMRGRGIEMPAGVQAFGSWTDGENTVLERVRRKTALLARARRLGIPIAGQTQFYEQPMAGGLRAAAVRLGGLARRVRQVLGGGR